MRKLVDLNAGESSTGLVFDGQDTAQIFATFLMDQDYGPLLKISYPGVASSSLDATYDHLELWSEGKAIPNTLVFSSVDGTATFHECVVIQKRHNFFGVTEFTLRPRAMLYGSYASENSEALRLSAVHSRIPALSAWLEKSPISRTI
ncbi:hypothetical protein [Arthrobacter crystallopoietes]|uniref:hypothetical protein n=1 Tax=Crystallibacter crystallopoietes TaxID=37928 RepID=UPI001ABEE674|nr:hypothetical protein [Arthrobacter crystallopoietes]QTG81723.1 hypothetical protein J5251_03745 [Arthrobacter crystallopoietes]